MSEGNTMPFLAHLAALRTHLMRASAYILSGAVIAFAAMDWIFNSVLLAPKESNFITYRLFCEAGTYLGLPSLCIGGFELNLLNTQMAGQFSLHNSSERHDFGAAPTFGATEFPRKPWVRRI